MRTLRYPKPRKKPPKLRTILRAAASTSRKALVLKAAGLWMLLQRAKEPSGVCPVCRKRRWSDAMHCFPKGHYPSLRFEPDNGAPGCRVCHRRIDSDHMAKELFFRRYLGDARYERLRLMSQVHGSKLDMQLVVMDLQARLAHTTERAALPDKLEGRAGQ